MQPKGRNVIQANYLRLFKPVFSISLGSRREENNCCALATYKDGGTGYAKACRQNGVLSSPTLGRDSGDHLPTNSLVRSVASAHVVPVVKSRPPASAGGLATFFSLPTSRRNLPRVCRCHAPLWQLLFGFADWCISSIANQLSHRTSPICVWSCDV